MKRLFVSLGIITVILTISLVGLWHLNFVTDQVEEYTTNIQTALDQNNITKAQELNYQLSGFWERQHRYLTLYIRHNNIDEISKTISELEQYLQRTDYAEFSSRLSYIQQLMLDMRDAEIPILFNIL
ncbi:MULTISPECIES: DUF4363 family protein [Clostridiaceae]|uniref:DUF4363 family protein n=1 Tax=Clostridium facile TaxID=2763035 RepID=A0ABR7IQT4_9CLOT|nr:MULTISPECIES: DUF4363 family protein [Clostridiaceae]MBC5787428.1 DUF4363 family protein [Clostridium facile]